MAYFPVLPLLPDVLFQIAIIAFMTTFYFNLCSFAFLDSLYARSDIVYL